MKQATWIAALLLTVLFSAGCAAEEREQPPATQAPEPAPAPQDGDDETDTLVPDEASAFPWMDVTLENVSTGERFMISDLKGRPVLVKSFAVW